MRIENARARARPRAPARAGAFEVRPAPHSRSIRSRTCTTGFAMLRRTATRSRRLPRLGDLRAPAWVMVAVTTLGIENLHAFDASKTIFDKFDQVADNGDQYLHDAHHADDPRQFYHRPEVRRTGHPSLRPDPRPDQPRLRASAADHHSEPYVSKVEQVLSHDLITLTGFLVLVEIVQWATRQAWSVPIGSFARWTTLSTMQTSTPHRRRARPSRLHFFPVLKVPVTENANGSTGTKLTQLHRADQWPANRHLFG